MSHQKRKTNVSIKDNQRIAGGTTTAELQTPHDGKRIVPLEFSTDGKGKRICTQGQMAYNAAISNLTSPNSKLLLPAPDLLNSESMITVPSPAMNFVNVVTNLTSCEEPNLPISSEGKPAATACIGDIVDAGITEEEINELIEGLGDDIDLMLDERAERNKLTVKNVKSILKHVITNKYVLTMVRNTMKWENNNECELEEAVFEPKLTRSKAKELRERREALPWPVSTPVKQTKKITNKLLFEDFSEEEGSSDEEYRPNDEELHSGEEDVSSAKIADVTPIQYVQPGEDCLFISDADPFHEGNKQTDRIALRTRSKLPLTDTPLEKIEASFIAPDFTPDMYEALIDDDDWQKFLTDFNKPLEEKDSSDQPDDDDPEYNVMDVVEEDDHEEEEEEHDETTEDPSLVTKEEMNALMSEILMEELVQMEDEGIEQQNVEYANQYVPTDVPSETEQSKEVNSWMTSYEKLQLEMQMRMHVQLLCQSFLLSHGIDELNVINKSSVEYLNELKNFSSSAEADGKASAFNSHNLNEAVSIVHAFQMPNMPAEITAPYSAGTKRKLRTRVKDAIAHSKVFMYPRLLPHVAFQLNTSHKVIFTNAEDNLIVLGWLQLDYLDQTNRCPLIQSLLVPAKTEQQIRFRIKNRKTAIAPEDNPIKRFFRYGEKPVIPRMLGNFDPSKVKAPCDMSAGVLPPWMATYISRPAFAPIAPQTSVTVSSRPSHANPTPKSIRQKPVVHKYSPILPRGYVSPLKKITPILKKYGHHRRILQMSPFSTFIATKPAVIAKPTTNRPIKPKPAISDEGSMPHVSGKDLTKSFMLPKKESLSIQVSISDSLTTEVMLAPSVNSSDRNEKVHSSNYQNSESLPKVSMQMEGKMDTAGASSDKMRAESKEDERKSMAAMEMDTQEDAEDDEEDMAALMAASSTICRKNSVIKKKNKHQKDLESTLALLSPTLMESDPRKEEREKLFAQSYLLRVMDALKNEPEKCEKFLKLLISFEYSNKTSLQLFTEVNEILREYPALVDDFVGFLLPEQAKECGKYLQYRTLYKIREFFRKLEVHFTHQPHHIQRILRAFTQLQQQAEITSASVIAVLQPLLRNQSHLLEEFIQLLPESTPPECLMTDFEEVEIPNSGDENSCDSYEEIVMPDVYDPYGGKDCPCTCHTSTSDIRMQNRNRHCVKCGTKFIDGRIYIQTGKVLKPAQVIYHETKPICDQSKETGLQTDAKNTPPSPSCNMGSANKAPKSQLLNFESLDFEKQASIRSFDVSHRMKTSMQDETFPKSIRQGISDPLASDCISPLPCDFIEDAVLLTDARNTSSSIPSDFSCLSKVIASRSDSEINSFAAMKQNFHLNSIVNEKSVSQPSVFNLSFMSTSGAESNVTHSGLPINAAAKSSEVQQWTREQDRLILETCQKHGTGLETLAELSKVISTASPQQIQNRFYELIELVKKRSACNR